MRISPAFYWRRVLTFGAFTVLVPSPRAAAQALPEPTEQPSEVTEAEPNPSPPETTEAEPTPSPPETEQPAPNEPPPQAEQPAPNEPASGAAPPKPTPPAPNPSEAAIASSERSEPQDAAPPPDVGPTISGGPGKGVTFTVSDAFSLNVRARIQVRYQLTVSPPEDDGQRELSQLVNIGTARLYFSGNAVVPQLTYMLQLALAPRDFRDGATSPIFDAYLEYAAHRDWNVRVGQYFVPFDRLRTVREWALQMPDRPRPVQEMTLDRDVGVIFFSDRFLGDRSPIAWRLGAFGGGGTNLSVGHDPGVLVVGRLELRPFGPLDDDKEGDLERRPHPALALGVGVAENFNTNRLRSTTGPTFVGGTTDYFHLAGDLVFKWSGFALQGEVLRKVASADTLVSSDADGAPVVEFTRSGWAWIAQASYVFDPPLEVVGRLSRLFADSGTDPSFVSEVEQFGQEVGAGLNYYFNDHRLKVQAGWIARMPTDFDFEQATHAMQWQVDATF